MRWRANGGGLSLRGLWETRRDGIIFLDEADGARDGVHLLRKALLAPHLDWIQEGGTLWMDMMNMPLVKDVGWAVGGSANCAQMTTRVCLPEPRVCSDFAE